MATTKQTSMHTHFHNAVPLVWGSFRLAPIKWFLNMNKHMYGWNPQKSTKHDGMTPQYFHIIPIYLPTVPCVCCVHRRVVEGSGVHSAGCVCMLMCIVNYIVGGCNLFATEHGRCGLFCHVRV